MELWEKVSKPTCTCTWRLQVSITGACLQYIYLHNPFQIHGFLTIYLEWLDFTEFYIYRHVYQNPLTICNKRNTSQNKLEIMSCKLCSSISQYTRDCNEIMNRMRQWITTHFKSRWKHSLFKLMCNIYFYETVTIGRFLWRRTLEMAGSFEELLKEMQAIHVKLNRQEEVLSVISGKLDQPVKIDNNIRYCRHGYEASDETSTDSLSCCSNTESTGMYQGIHRYVPRYNV